MVQQSHNNMLYSQSATHSGNEQKKPDQELPGGALDGGPNRVALSCSGAGDEFFCEPREIVAAGAHEMAAVHFPVWLPCRSPDELAHVIDVLVKLSHLVHEPTDIGVMLIPHGADRRSGDVVFAFVGGHVVASINFMGPLKS